MAGRQTNEKSRRASSRRRGILLLASFLLIGTVTAGTVLAYVHSRTQPIANVFSPAEVSCQVLESFDQHVKSDVKIRNTGTADAYIRVAVVATWVSDQGTEVYAARPKEGAEQDYTVAFADDYPENWLTDADGFYYYTGKVPAGGTTAQLIKTCTVNAGRAPAGFHLSVEILASAVQASPETVAEEQWHVVIKDGRIVQVSADGGNTI